MNASDVIVLGAGLAGLSAARDLAAAGVDVRVLEARGRVGGRVEQTELADGRLVQLGGEVVGPSHTAYAKLVDELGLTLVPAFAGLPGDDVWVLADGRVSGEGIPWFSDDDRRSYEIAERAFGDLVRSVDPDDPWSHPEAERLDRLSVAQWLREVGATPNVVRARDVAMLALAAESVERTSLLSDLRKEAAVGSTTFYDYDVWEVSRVDEGSATVALRMAAELGHRITLGAVVDRVSLSTRGCTVTLASGERYTAGVVISTIPAGPLRSIRIDGLSDARRASLDRQRHALTSKVTAAYSESFWAADGLNGTAYAEVGMLGGTWVQRDGILSALVPPERQSAFLATSPERLHDELIDELVAAFGPRAREVEQLAVRRWAIDPFTLGYITSWRPGDVTGVGSLHGTHEPPFYVAGSDQWVCGYMEGAVRTGRAAAAAVLAQGT
ncbi:flavin monoamine oxidase family protein [Microcella sp.]|uniref:flavin monoamine oxidase family protein n=1 Tax=Microcella sp. TaxID=1913979 RepID=UPI002561B219|nr:NAD(P)/FAD-dependent oxidoreductase [Microcella sp.]MBX9472507.1 FAD-dependent oxidoreductase [Microcella sp.]